MKTQAIASLLLVTCTSAAIGQSRSTGDYYAASLPNAANMSTITHELATYGVPSSVTSVVRNDIPGNVLAIEPEDHDGGFILVLARDNVAVPNTSRVYRLWSPFLGGPFVPSQFPSGWYAAPAGSQLTDLKVDIASGGFLTLAIDSLNRITLQRHSGAGPVIASVPNLTTAPSASVAVDSSNGDVYVLDSNGQLFRYTSVLAPISSGSLIPPMSAATDIVIDNSGGRIDRVVASGNLGGLGTGVYRFTTNGVIFGTELAGTASELSVDFEGNLTSMVQVGAGVLPMMNPSTGVTAYPFMSAGAQQLSAMTWTSTSAFGSYSTTANSLLAMAPRPAHIGDPSMDYGFASTTTLASLTYMISLTHSFPGALLAPNAEMLVDLNDPSAMILPIAIPTGQSLIIPGTLPASLNGIPVFSQLLGLDTNMNLVASNGVSQTVGLRPIE